MKNPEKHDKHLHIPQYGIDTTSYSPTIYILLANNSFKHLMNMGNLEKHNEDSPNKTRRFPKPPQYKIPSMLQSLIARTLFLLEREYEIYVGTQEKLFPIK